MVNSIQRMYIECRIFMNFEKYKRCEIFLASCYFKKKSSKNILSKSSKIAKLSYNFQKTICKYIYLVPYDRVNIEIMWHIDSEDICVQTITHLETSNVSFELSVTDRMTDMFEHYKK